MKIDLGAKPYEETTSSKKPEPYYPSTEIEDNNVPVNDLGKDIKCEVIVRVTRSEIRKEAGKPMKACCRIEFRSIKFPKGELKDQDVQDDISDEIESLNKKDNYKEYDG